MNGPVNCPCGHHDFSTPEERTKAENRGEALTELRRQASHANSRKHSRTARERDARDQEEKDV